MWLLCLFMLAGAEAGFFLPAIAFGRAAEHVTWESTTTKLPETDIHSIDITKLNDSMEEAPDVDSLRARAHVLKQRILKQQVELQRLERRLVATDDLSWIGFSVNNTLHSFRDSSNVLRRKLKRVEGKVGIQNERWHGSVREFMVAQTHSGVRIVDRLLHNSTQLRQLLDPETPKLLAHVPAILARLDRLEGHVPEILEKVLNNHRHLAYISPHLPQILERFDDIGMLDSSSKH